MVGHVRCYPRITCGSIHMKTSVSGLFLNNSPGCSFGGVRVRLFSFLFCVVLCVFCLSSSCVLNDQQAAASEAFYCVVNTRHRFKSHSWDDGSIFCEAHKFRMCYNPDKLHGIKWVFQSKLKMNCYRTVDKNSTTGVTSGAGTSHPSGASDFTPFSSWNSCCSIFGFCVEFDRTLFVFVYCSLWALYVLLPIEVSD